MDGSEEAVPRWLGFASVLADELGDATAVSVDRIEAFVCVTVLPRRPGARSVSWLHSGDEITLHVGQLGGTWALGTADEDVDLLEDIVRSVVAGRVREVIAPGRSQVVVTLSGGQRRVATSIEMPVGCLPLPYWPRLSRTIAYLPYR